MISKKLLDEYNRVGFTHLHLHTDASHLDGMNDIPSLISRLKDIKAEACAISDHGNMHNAIRFYQACKINKIKPILGFEAYITDARQLQKKSDFMIVEEAIDDDFVHVISHLVMLAENFKGYQNLCELTSLGFSEGVYNKPRIDYELIRKHSEGVIVINGHVGTDIAKSFERACNPVSQKELEIMSDSKFSSVEKLKKRIAKLTKIISDSDSSDDKDDEKQDLEKLQVELIVVSKLYEENKDEIESEYAVYSEREIARAYTINEWYMSVFGDKYYLEIQNHNLDIEKQVTPMVIKLAQDHNVTLVMTNDSHYTWKSDADAQRIHMANGLGQNYEEFMNSDFEGFTTCDEFYVKDSSEMLEMALPYGEVAVQALINTSEISDRCNVEMEAMSLEGIYEKKGKMVGDWKSKEYLFPDFTIPPPYSTGDEYLKHLSREGLKDRIAENEVDLVNYTAEDYSKRLEYEMSVINDMGFPTYFIIVWDVLRFCRESDIPVGKGRGSGAGSLVAYSLRITDIDPLHYLLIFERFLNPHRISMPDLDIDFCYNRIQEVIDYTKDKYGHDKVCKIGTFGTLSAKAVIKDVSRVLRYDYQTINTLTVKVAEVGIKIKDILESYPEFATLYEEDMDFKRVIDVSLRLEGLQRHTSQHAAGIIISPFPLTELIPLKGKGGDTTAQFDMIELEALGFVKMDYLRLRTLSVIKDATNAIEAQLGEVINIDKIDLADPLVYKMFQDGESLGIFQFESPGMRSILKKQKPVSIEDLSAVNALNTSLGEE